MPWIKKRIDGSGGRARRALEDPISLQAGAPRDASNPQRSAAQPRG